MPELQLGDDVVVVGVEPFRHLERGHVDAPLWILEPTRHRKQRPGNTISISRLSVIRPASIRSNIDLSSWSWSCGRIRGDPRGERPEPNARARVRSLSGSSDRPLAPAGCWSTTRDWTTDRDRNERQRSCGSRLAGPTPPPARLQVETATGISPRRRVRAGLRTRELLLRNPERVPNLRRSLRWQRHLRSSRLPSAHRFPAPVWAASACGGRRSRLPLRGSPGFSPGSLLISRAAARDTSTGLPLAERAELLSSAPGAAVTPGAGATPSGEGRSRSRSATASSPGRNGGGRSRAAAGSPGRNSSTRRCRR